MKLTAKSANFLVTEYRKIYNLLKSAFPKNEQTPLFLLLLGAILKNMRFTVFYNADEFAGFLYSIENDKYYFILYIAVNPQLRSRGCGGAILDYAYGQAAGKNIVLNVEPLDPDSDNYKQRQRRIAFYEKHGIRNTGYMFYDKEVPYSVLASDASMFNPEEYGAMLRVHLITAEI